MCGGCSRQTQVDALAEGVDIVVATLGRLLDFSDNSLIDLRSVTFLVVDGVDRMLHLGQEPELQKVLKRIQSDRQTFMTSAVWSAGVQRLVKFSMSSPIQVFINFQFMSTH